MSLHEHNHSLIDQLIPTPPLHEFSEQCKCGHPESHHLNWTGKCRYCSCNHYAYPKMEHCGHCPEDLAKQRMAKLRARRPDLVRAGRI